MMPRDEVAAALGISPDTVRIIEYRALAKLRAWANARGLTLPDLSLDWIEPEDFPLQPWRPNERD